MTGHDFFIFALQDAFPKHLGFVNFKEKHKLLFTGGDA